MPEDLKTYVNAGEINNLEKVAIIAKVQFDDLRKSLIKACLEGKSVKELREAVRQETKTIKQKELAKKSEKRGRAATRVNMGFTMKTHVVKYLIERVIESQEYKSYSKHFSDIDWGNYDQVTGAFKNLVGILENKLQIERE
jgi:poly-D-alanine transfer protein DltD